MVELKCRSCGCDAVSEVIENYLWDADLGVTLRGVPVRRCADCGAAGVVVKGLEKLTEAIAAVIVGGRTRLTPSEVTFLREYLGVSGAELARRIGVTANSVSRWETGTVQINKTADQLLRMMASPPGASVAGLPLIKNRRRATNLHFVRKGKKWVPYVPAKSNQPTPAASCLS